MMRQAGQKYRRFDPMEAVSSAGKPFQPSWPMKHIDQAPIWMSTDLRDGNQAIEKPMNIEQKLEYFKMLRTIGFKEVEIGFPSASTPDYDFTRLLIEDGHVPDDMKLIVLTQARPHLIQKTMESMKGAKNGIVHVYAATAPIFREAVFKKTKDEVMKMACDGIKMVRDYCTANPETNWGLEFSPEAFSQTELPFARDICDAAAETWRASRDNKIIINLPATVEVSSPDVFATQVEWMCQNMKNRENMVVSVHTHNDRGCAVAAAELALKAGAERVEGCLLGNGERTGNVDLITMAMNMYAQGVDSKLDFSNLDEIIDRVVRLTDMPISPRHPYAGAYVYTAFSGGHQDAIQKGLAAHEEGGGFNVPYLPVDPKDVGRDYEAIIRVNSQSGKAAAAYALESVGIKDVPAKLLVSFSKIVQDFCEQKGREVSKDEILALFEHEYLGGRKDLAVHYSSHKLTRPDQGDVQKIDLNIQVEGDDVFCSSVGNGPIDASIKALDLPLEVVNYQSQAMSPGSDARAICFLEMRVKGQEGTFFGIGVDPNTTTASIRAVFSGVNRAVRANQLSLDGAFSSYRPSCVRQEKKGCLLKTVEI